MGDFFFDKVLDRIFAPLFGPKGEPQDAEPVGPVDTRCEEIEQKYHASYFWRGPQRYDLEEKWLQCRARSEGWAKREEEPKRRSFLSDLLSTEGKSRHLGIGLLAFCPWLIPLAEVQASLPLPDFIKDLNFSFDGVLESFRAFNQKAAEGRKKFEEEIEGAIRNPALGDLNQGDLFVFDEAGLNDLITELLSKGKQKVRNVKVKIDGDQLKISGEYDHWSGWIDFTAVAEFEQKDGESSGYIKKVTAIGMDLTDNVKNDLLNSFRNFGIEPPEGADIKDLSWVQIPGIKRIEIRRDLVILEREPKPGGPS